MPLLTNVPVPVLGPKGFVAPNEAQILAGLQADFDLAFGTVLNKELNTPQGQLCSSLTAIIGNCYNTMVQLFNNVDPAFASGRMQDAIARIYFLTRIPASATAVLCTCSGLENTPIPVGAQAEDQGGNIYLCTEAGTIPSGGSIDLQFQCATTGPIACPPGFLSVIYRAIPGWDSITNAGDGVEGQNVESRSDFEYRRQQTVAANAQGTLDSIIGAVFEVEGVLDAYGYENKDGVTSGAAFTAAISGTTMTVSAVSDGTLNLGDTVIGAGVAQGTIITAFGSGSGNTGTYQVNETQTVGSESMTSAFGGVRLVPHSIYIAVVGGLEQDVLNAIWSKKSPGANYNGNTTGIVTAPGPASNPYSLPLPTYSVTYEIPGDVGLKFAISIIDGPNVPSDAISQIQQAVLATFNGTNGSPRARIGSKIFASQYYGPISALGSWVLIDSILLGVAAANSSSVLMQINQAPTLDISDINVTLET